MGKLYQKISLTMKTSHGGTKNKSKTCLLHADFGGQSRELLAVKQIGTEEGRIDFCAVSVYRQRLLPSMLITCFYEPCPTISFLLPCVAFKFCCLRLYHRETVYQTPVVRSPVGYAAHAFVIVVRL